MSLRFRVARALTAPQRPLAANDNPPPSTGQDFGRRVLLRDALRHFAAHGAGAADIAWSNAQDAFFAGRRRNYLHWMAIFRALDRRMIEAAQPAK